MERLYDWGANLSYREIEVNRFDFPNPNPDIDFLIYDVGTDSSVVSTIKEREGGLIKSGCEIILGLRDMYPEKYDDSSGGRIDDSKTQEFIEGMRPQIAAMSHSEKIRINFAIMEMEAWLLMMYRIFERIDSALTVDFIKARLNVDLAAIDPQKEFYKPSNFVTKIFNLCRSTSRYKKSTQMEKIASKITDEDILEAESSDKCQSFKKFYYEIERIGN